ncbi:MAG: phosphoribosyltransferase family protein [Candidatus Bathyarchaeota archaeon]|nr:phosphoribosyltransferase family protein [Candidatus Bathyarchaeota archaeon]
MSETHLQDIKFRLMTIDLLRVAKKKCTYREIGSKTGLPVTVLSRYVKGHVLPGAKRAKKIWDVLKTIVSLEDELRRRIKFDSRGYFDNTSIISDVPLLKQAAQHALSKFAGKRITKVLTAAVDGVPLATIISETLGVDILIAKKSKEVGVKDFVEEMFIPGDSAVVTSLYLPKGVIRRSDSVLIVDDVIKSGETQRALMDLVSRFRADVAGVFSLIAVDDGWVNKLRGPFKCPVEVVLTVRPRGGKK